MDGGAEMTLGDYVSVVRRRRWIVASAVLLVVGAALVITTLQTPIYSASSEILVQPRGLDGLFDDAVVDVDDRSVQTEIQVIEGEQVRERVRADLALDELPSPVTAAAVGGTDVIALTVRDPSASDVAAIADAYADAYIEVRREQATGELMAASVEVQAAIDGLQSQVDALSVDDPRRSSLVAQLVSFNTTLDQLRVDAALRTGGALVVRSAQAPSDPVEPTPVRTVGFALVLGILVGLAIAFVVDHLDDKLRSAGDVARVTDRPVLAVVPADPPPDNRPIALSAPGHVAAEAFRGLRTYVQFLGLDGDCRVIQLTSSVAGEGKTTTASNLAVVLAQAGHRVAVIDADLRRPRLHEVFGVPQCPGLTDLLAGVDANDVVRHVDVDVVNRLSVYASGSLPANSSELLSGRASHRLFARFGEQYDYVIVDSAPILPVSDSVALARSVQGVVVVAHAGSTRESELTDTLNRLDRVGAVVMGVVLNQVTESSASTYAYTHDPSGANHHATGFESTTDPDVSDSKDQDDWTRHPPASVAVDMSRGRV